ncbi:hypothetical protein F406_gp067 [Agrobacterium phage 7-7-1]|uniref:Uncharacterized protein n=1 Tax=Agrobacterium phage 7-7-1 TaxID=1161931 RepID=J7FAR0_9CAUD|nr:hypothetical protein F406_gp067 [Agrobacterium phage 7-7-1]AFH19748.1 hypothetical protein 7-7-1_00050 [Agrobacterium phage 7-7-1]
MIIENIKLHWAHIYGDMPDYNDIKSRNKAGVQAFAGPEQPATLEEFSFLREYGPHEGKRVFKATSLHVCRVEVVGRMYGTFADMMEVLDTANVNRNRIFTTGPVSVDVDPGVREEGARAFNFIHLNRIIVDVDRLDIWEVLK